jgi:hypothetical protein
MQLLGTKHEIEERLVGSSDLEVAEGLDASADHRRLGNGDDHRPSPLTYADEQRLLQIDGPPVRLLFGTDATQIDLIAEALDACTDSPDWPDLEIREHKKVPAPLG